MLLSLSLSTSLQGIRQLPIVRSDNSEIGCVFTFSPRSCSSEYSSCYWPQTARLFFFLILVVSLILCGFFPFMCVSPMQMAFPAQFLPVKYVQHYSLLFSTYIFLQGPSLFLGNAFVFHISAVETVIHFLNHRFQAYFQPSPRSFM